MPELFTRLRFARSACSCGFAFRRILGTCDFYQHNILLQILNYWDDQNIWGENKWAMQDLLGWLAAPSPPAPSLRSVVRIRLRRILGTCDFTRVKIILQLS